MDISRAIAPHARGARLVRRAAPILIALSTVVIGCRDPDQPGSLPSVTTYPVKGQVLLRDGKPLTEGTVTFVPLAEGGRFPSGPIEADGTFSVSTKDCGEGAPVGEYAVRVTSDIAAVTKKHRGEAHYAVAPKYRDESTSGLKVYVKPEPNELDPFRLK